MVVEILMVEMILSEVAVAMLDWGIYIV